MALSPPYLLLIFTSISGLIVFSSLRLLAILPPYRGRPKKRTRDASRPARILVVLGSGGHTAEMLAMLDKVDMLRFQHRTYVASSGDTLSADKAHAFEQHLRESSVTSKGSVGDAMRGDGVPMVASRTVKQRVRQQQQQQQQQEERDSQPVARDGMHVGEEHYAIYTLPRARRIHQSILTAPYSCVLTLYAALCLLHDMPYPDVIITNGPATGVIVVLASVILRFFDIADVESEGRGGNDSEGGRGLVGGEMRTVYVESWARVKRLSLSGRVLVRIVDRFLVQWKGLQGAAGGRGEYRGVLV